MAVALDNGSDSTSRDDLLSDLNATGNDAAGILAHIENEAFHAGAF